MHLKSLVLKGFKSFADRSVLRLGPGITAVVGPNGSGKSNISDAVLWVLGERNARHLRGQFMEDVIFSGSAARKPVSVAEVELVLDNSDGTLAVEFDEVSIARRLYRSGESEYLINGVVARRMDVLDILHDSGLGQGTHSIISQGNLDAILQSSAEERRALIEEAAGVLKHRQRKEKSARKMERMGVSLNRVRDLWSELDRQLAPLERKARRARAHEKASARLKEVELALAVDDLRRLQTDWDAALAHEQTLGQEMEGLRAGVESAEQRAADLQGLLEREEGGAGMLARRQRRASAAAERLDAASLLLREKRRAAHGYAADLARTRDASARERERALAERDEAARALDEARCALEAAQEEVRVSEEARAQAARERREKEQDAERLEAEAARLARERRSAIERRDQLAGALSAAEAQQKLAQARREELGLALARAQEDCARADAAAQDAERAADELEEARARAARAAARSVAERDQARAARDSARSEAHALAAEAEAAQRALKAFRADKPALAWLVEHACDIDAHALPLASSVSVPAGIEDVVERVLGDDAQAVIASGAASARSLARALVDAGRPGDVSLLMSASPADAPARADGEGALVKQVHSKPEAHAALASLIGDVVVCDSVEDAFAAHAADTRGLRFASKDGCVVWPNGKVEVHGPVADGHEGLIARERRLADLEAARAAAEAELPSLEERLAEAEESVRAAQAASLAADQRAAEKRGQAASARTDARTAQHRLDAACADLEASERKSAEASRTLEALAPDAQQADDLIARLVAAAHDAEAAHDEALSALKPLRRAAGQAAERLSEAKTAAAGLVERTAYAERMVAARAREVERAEEGAARTRTARAMKRAAAARADEARGLVDALADALASRLATLNDALVAAEGAQTSFREQVAGARRDARTARDAFDAANARMTQAQVAKGQLEVRVASAVSAIVDDCGCPLERAQSHEALSNRQEAEEEAEALRRRIKNMGTVNPDAAREYDELAERVGFLAGQIADMDQAAHALDRIVRVVDARMRAAFTSTFEQVDRNFQETFATLFPGGRAELVLENPDDLENTGIEVKAQPSGKRITKMTLLSGGEKSLTALALLFSVYRVRATPFYILDEVEAALDDTNLRRLASYIDELRGSTQLIMITHQRRTMEMADVLFGVSMHADGVTKVVSQKLEHALRNAE